MNNSIILAGISLLLAVSNLSAATHYVALESINPRPPYSTWATAATNIQDAVNVAATNDVVMVTSGVYPGGVTVTRPLTLLSVTGPQFTVIDGGGTVQCISLADGASLTGFTLTNGYAHPGGGDGGAGVYGGTLYNCTLANNRAAGIQLVSYHAVSGGGAKSSTLYNCTLTDNSSTDFGGGAYGCTLFDCTLTGNSVYGGEYLLGGGAYGCTLNNCTLSGNSADYGGGAYVSALINCTLNSNSALANGGGAESSTLDHCTVTDNEAYLAGGGADYCTLDNCTLTGNSAGYGGGAYVSTLYNCTLTDNQADLGGGGADSCTLYNCIAAYNAGWADDNYTTNSTLNYCCTTPLPANGFRNISVPPQFMDYASGNLRLQSNSPCINAGGNLYVTTATDLDGNPRVVGGTVDIGAYEYQTPTSILSYAWAQAYGLPTDGSVDYIDSDHDGLNNWQEWVCGTCPTNARSVLRVVSVVPQGADVTVTWQSAAGINYFLECATNLAALPTFTCLATNLAGQPDLTTYIHSNAAGTGPRFYRVGVSAQ